MSRSTLTNALAFGIFAIGVLAFFQYENYSSVSPAAPTQVSAVADSIPPSVATSTPVTTATTIASTTPLAATSTPQKPKKTIPKATSPVATVPSTPATEVARIQNPYSTPPESFDTVNTQTRSALVNVLCESQGGSLQPISGSGVLIDPRGVILTNAHVAQYVLLSESPAVNLKCYIRTGSPATTQWTVSVLYIPPVWVDQHASEIHDAHPTGTGEHDYALLYITGSATGNPLPASFPYLPIDTRPAIGFPGDSVLVASYPAEFLGGIAAQYNLYSASSVTTIQQLLTFNSGTVDALSLGGIIEAQSGSSGGAVVNAWGRLIALVATTSAGTTTADRDLRGVTLDYINTDLATQSGSNLITTLQGDPLSEAQNFTTNTAPGLIAQYISQLSQ